MPSPTPCRSEGERVGGVSLPSRVEGPDRAPHVPLISPLLCLLPPFLPVHGVRRAVSCASCHPFFSSPDLPPLTIFPIFPSPPSWAIFPIFPLHPWAPLSPPSLSHFPIKPPFPLSLPSRRVSPYDGPEGQRRLHVASGSPCCGAPCTAPRQGCGPQQLNNCWLSTQHQHIHVAPL